MRFDTPDFDSNVPRDVVQHCTTWNRCLETLWIKVVAANMREGYLDDGDPPITTRLILGMILWVSRWYRPSEEISPTQIAEAVIQLMRLRY
jgi:hypothetical protein